MRALLVDSSVSESTQRSCRIKEEEWTKPDGLGHDVDSDVFGLGLA